MNLAEAAETASWRRLSREAQGLTTERQVRAQAIVDVAESVRKIAAQRGSDPLDDLLELHARVHSVAAKQIVAECLRYLRSDPAEAPPARPRYRILAP